MQRRGEGSYGVIPATLKATANHMQIDKEMATNSAANTQEVKPLLDKRELPISSRQARKIVALRMNFCPKRWPLCWSIYCY